jgi:hypothetical protein
MSESARPRLLVAMTIDDDWERVELVREAVARCVVAAYGDDDLRDALSMVAAELLENAVKYGQNGASIRFRLEDAGELAITVTNTVAAGSADAAKLKERLDWLHTFADPGEAYLQTMAEVFKSGKVDDSTSGLGLLRIAYEGACAVECDLSEPGAVTVRARRRRSDAGA